MRLTLKKGSVDHDCQPACELHDLEKSGPATGVASSQPSRKADMPKPASPRGLRTSAWHQADGEEVAREHLHAEVEPQLQKATSEQGSVDTAGGAYASRDSPKAQGMPPTDGKTDEEIVSEDTAGDNVTPDSKDAKAPDFAGK